MKFEPMPTAADSREPSSESLSGEGTNWKSVLVAVAILVAACLLTFGRATTNQFLLWDDSLHITDNPYLTPPTEEGLGRLWGSAYAGLYNPMAYTWWAAVATIAASLPDATEGVIDPVPFHVGNLALHTACVLLVFVVLRRLVDSVPGALLGALLFAVHPLQAESVNWASEARGLLAGLFGLIALWLYLRVTEMEFETAPVETNDETASNDDSREEKSRVKSPADESDSDEELDEYDEEYDLPPIPVARYIVYALATAAFLIALLSKPSAVVIPLLAWVLDFAWLGRRPKGRPEVWSDWSLLVVWALISVGMSYTSKSFQTGLGDAQAQLWWVRPLIAGDALCFYLYKLSVPVWLCTDYGRTPTVVVGHWWGYLTWFVPALGVALLWRVSRPAPWLTAVAISVIAVLPVLGLVPFAFQFYSTVADRYMYLAMLGPALAVAWLVRTTRRKEIVYGVAIALGVLAMLSVRQSGFWHDNDTLFRHTLDVNPRSFMAYANLGNQRLADGEYAEAQQYIQSALAIFPRHLESLISMGLVLRKQGELERAVPFLQRAVEINRNSAPALNALGIAYQDQGRIEEAMTLLNHAIRSNPHYYQARISLGNLLVEQNRTAEAIDQFNEAIRTRPGLNEANFGIAQAMLKQLGNKGVAVDREVVEKIIALLESVYSRDPEYPQVRIALARSHQLLADLLKVEQRFDAAEQQLRMALKLDPESITLRIELANVYLEQGRFERVEATLRQIIEVDKRNVEARIGLGNLLVDQGHPEEALREYEGILAINPEYAGAYYQIGLTLQGMGRFAEAVESYRSALKYRDQWNGWPIATNNLAWILATVDDPVLRDGEEAVRLAKELVESFSEKLPSDFIEYLDTLAAAHAEAGQFKEAVAVTRRAKLMAVKRQDAELEDRFRQRLELYLTERSLHDVGIGVDAEVRAANPPNGSLPNTPVSSVEATSGTGGAQSSGVEDLP